MPIAVDIATLQKEFEAIITEAIGLQVEDALQQIDTSFLSLAGIGAEDFVGINRREAKNEGILNDVSRTTAVVLPSFIDQLATEAHNRITTQASIRQAASTAMANLVPLVTASLTDGFAGASDSLRTIRSVMDSVRVTLAAAANLQLNNTLALEPGRAIVKNGTLTTQLSTLTSTYTMSLNTSIYREVSRSQLACNKSLDAVVLLPPFTSGANDSMPWFVDMRFALKMHLLTCVYT